jgi:hypothetical protein
LLKGKQFRDGLLGTSHLSYMDYFFLFYIFHPFFSYCVHLEILHGHFEHRLMCSIRNTRHSKFRCWQSLKKLLKDKMVRNIWFRIIEVHIVKKKGFLTIQQHQFVYNLTYSQSEKCPVNKKASKNASQSALVIRRGSVEGCGYEGGGE